MTSNERVSATRNAPCRRRPVLAGLGCLVLCAPLLASACKSDGALGPDGTGGFVPIWSSPPTMAGGDWIGGTPAVDGGRVFVQEAYNLVGLDGAAGRPPLLRALPIAPSPRAPPLLAARGPGVLSGKGTNH